MNKWDFVPTKNKQDPYENVIDLLNPCTPDEFMKMTEEDKQKQIDIIFNEIRKINVFPIFYFNEDGIKEEIQKAIDRKVGIDDEVNIFYHEGLVLLDYLFPNLHYVNTLSGNMIERFYDDNKLKECIRDYIITRPIYNMRTVFFSTARFKWNTAINYSPMRAKAIYEKFCPKDGVIYDFCAGFGGRMLGALSSSKNFTYIGTDPNTETYENLLKEGTYIEEVTERKNSFKIYNECAENLDLKEKSVDFVFSCPPFFDLERYTDEETQSYIRYSNYEEWLECFVRPSIKKCISAMKPEGIYCVDVENFQSKGKEFLLPLDWIQIAEEEGLSLQKTLPIKSRSRKRNNWSNNIYIFTKNGVTLKDYSDPETLKEWHKLVEENKKRHVNKDRVIAEYDIKGNLIQIFKYYNSNLNISLKDIKYSNNKNKAIENKFYKIYEKKELVLDKIKSPIICEINNIYFDSYAEVGRYLKTSRQAVHQAKRRNAPKIGGYDIHWFD